MNDQLAAAKQAIATGQKPRAIKILRDLVATEPDNIQAWLYLAGLAPHARGREACLRRAELIDPAHPLVLKARQWAAGGAAQPEPPAVAPAAPASEPEPELVSQPPAPPAPEPKRFENAPATAARSTGRIVWITAALIILCLLVAGGSLAFVTGWPFSQTVAEPAAGESLGDNAPAIVATQTVAATAPSQTSAADQFSNDGRRLSAPETPAGNGTVPGKTIVDDGSQRQPWTATPSPTHTPTATPTPTHTPTIPPTFISEAANVVRPAFIGLNERWIDVNLTSQTLNAYEGNKLVFSTLISSGLPAYPTVTGQFRIYLEFEVQTMDGRTLGYDYVVENVPWVMYFFEDYAIHGAYWHNNFGYPMSHGCVNMSVADSQWIYGWASIGTLVNVHY